MQSRLAYDTITQVKTDKETTIILGKKIYNQLTGDIEKEAQTKYDVLEVQNRIERLQEEIVKLQALQDRVDMKDFNSVEDKRTPETKLSKGK